MVSALATKYREAETLKFGGRYKFSGGTLKLLQRTLVFSLKDLLANRHMLSNYNQEKIGPYGPELIWHFGK